MLEMIDEDKAYELKESASGQNNMLILDADQSLYQSVVEIMKEETNYVIHHALTWEEADKLSTEYVYDIAFVGLSIIKEQEDYTKRLHENKLARFHVLMSAQNGQNMFELCKKYNCSDYITMPFNELQFREIVHALAVTHD